MFVIPLTSHKWQNKTRKTATQTVRVRHLFVRGYLASTSLLLFFFGLSVSFQLNNFFLIRTTTFYHHQTNGFVFSLHKGSFCLNAPRSFTHSLRLSIDWETKQILQQQHSSESCFFTLGGVQDGLSAAVLALARLQQINVCPFSSPR